jgi:phospholipid transport system substrate-binding protein
MRAALISFAVVCLTITLSPAIAQTGPGTSSASPFYSQPRPPVPDPRETIERGLDRIKAFLATSDQTNPALINQFIEKEVAPFFDFNAMTQQILGPLNYRMTPLQRQGAVLKVKRSFLSALANNLAKYRGGDARYLKATGNLNRGRVRVRLAVFRPDTYPTILELRIVHGATGWKVVDVSADGISAVAYYRNYVRSVVQRSGLDGLLEP